MCDHLEKLAEITKSDLNKKGIGVIDVQVRPLFEFTIQFDGFKKKLRIRRAIIICPFCGDKLKNNKIKNG